MRSVRSFYIRYRPAAAHVHCPDPWRHGTDSLIFWLDRYKLLIIKENKHRMPGREDSNLDSKSPRNQCFSAVGLSSYPESYPSVAHTGVLSAGTARYPLIRALSRQRVLMLD